MSKVLVYKDVRKGNCYYSMMIHESDFFEMMYRGEEEIIKDTRPISVRIKENICTFDYMKFVWSNRMCKKHGHKYDVTGSYANGEGAKDEFECSRCGFSFSHVYF